MPADVWRLRGREYAAACGEVCPLAAPFARAGCGQLSPAAAGALVSYAVFPSECGRERLRFFFLPLPISVCGLGANGVQMSASVKDDFSFVCFYGTNRTIMVLQCLLFSSCWVICVFRADIFGPASLRKRQLLKGEDGTGT